MHKIKEIILVEGKYDKNHLSQFLDATIIETKGFGLFSDKEKLAMLVRLAENPGLVIFTDSDSGGFLIRNHLKGKLQGGRVLHAYIPDRLGKERRKTQAGKEGKLGVEGIDKETLIQSLRHAGATFLDEDAKGKEQENNQKLTKTHFYEFGLTGHAESGSRRKALQKNLDLPANLSTNGLLEVLNAMYDFNTAIEILEQSVLKLEKEAEHA